MNSNTEDAIRLMLDAEPPQPEKDGAGIYIPRNLDSNIRHNALKEVLERITGGKI